MEHNPQAVQDLIALIKTCKKMGVSEIKHGDLEIKFSSADTGTLGPMGDTSKPPTDQELEETALASRQTSEDEALIEDLATLQIDNPEAFEDLLVQREIEFGTGEEAAND